MADQITEFSGTVPALNQTQPDFDQNTQDFIDYMANLAPELNAYAASLNTLSTTTSSTSSVAIGTGTKNFTVEPGKSLFPGMSHKQAYDANNWMLGDIISYNSGTGALSIDVDTVRGSGTYAIWTGTLSFNGQIETTQLADGIFNDLTSVAPALIDLVPIADASDSGNKKSALLSAVRDLFAPKGYIDGLIMSTAGSSATMTIAAGEAKDSGNVVLIQLAASISKTTSAWAVGTGNGGKSQTGAVANTTWDHFYLIRRPDTGVVDVCFSTNATGLAAGDFVSGGGNVPDAYTQWRYIGSGYTDGSAQWTKFLQLGDYFYWSTPSISASNVTVGAARANVTTLTPLGIRTVGIYNVYLSNTGTSSLRLYGLDDDDAAISADNATLVNAASSTQNQTTKNVITNTSSQVSWRAGAAGTTGCYLQTLGYINQRGRNT